MPPKRRLSESSDGQDAGVEDPEARPGSGGAEEEEKVRAGPGRPKKKKVDPSQQLQVRNTHIIPFYIDCVDDHYF